MTATSKRRKGWYKSIAGLLVIVFFGQSCAVIGPKYQKVPVTSNPPQAKITVDDKFVGQTPVNLKLRKNEEHLIRIEMDGYEPAEIVVSPATGDEKSVGSAVVAGVPLTLIGMAFGALVSLLAAPRNEVDHVDAAWVWGGIAVGAIPGIYIMVSSYQTQLQPQRVYVLLKKAAEGGQSSASGSGAVQRLEISTEELSSVKWISIYIDNK
ncbi:MAG TPA: PEGA domain-containing protein [Candidatus Saccharicenans sp.]|nr:PEGA domain-containing protein [Candidatus Saccharicenans sp.]